MVMNEYMYEQIKLDFYGNEFMKLKELSFSYNQFFIKFKHINRMIKCLVLIKYNFDNNMITFMC